MTIPFNKTNLTLRDVVNGVRGAVTIPRDLGNLIASGVVAVYVLVVTVFAGSPAWLGVGIIAAALANAGRVIAGNAVAARDVRDFDVYHSDLIREFSRYVPADLGPETQPITGPLG